MKKHARIIAFLLLAVSLGGNGLHPNTAASTEPVLGDYTDYPIFLVNSVKPNILIILDNSGSMNFQAYTGDYHHNKKYYGYFEPYKKYTYSSNVFTRSESGEWDGNFLNWLTMRRIDVLRKVIMGGKAKSRQGNGAQILVGEDPAQSGKGYLKIYVDTDGVTPFSSSTTYNYFVDGGNFWVDLDQDEQYESSEVYTIKVQKDSNYPDEAPEFVDGNIAGVLQKVGDKARWGNEFFNYGTGSHKNGGYIASTIGTNLASLITDLQNTGCDTWTPLAESYYVAMQYFRQEDVDPNLSWAYPNNAIPHSNDIQDPYYDGNDFVHCAKSFVILLTDGASTKDLLVPDNLKNYDNDTHETDRGYSCEGSDYLDDIALYARTNDLRSDLQGDQNLILYTIYAFGNEGNARVLLQDAAKNGGFEDKNGNHIPDQQAEWDENNDGVPDTYFEAQDGYRLEAKLLQAINDILKRAASGTSVSVLATRAQGEGTITQAYFRTSVPEGLREVKWTGYLQSLWVDSHGNMREDTDHDLKLDITKDKIVKYFIASDGDTKIRLYDVSDSNPYPDTTDTTSLSPTEVELDKINPLWEAGNLLANRSPDDRIIYTYIDKDEDNTVDSGEFLSFNAFNASQIQPYLGVKSSTWDYLGSDQNARASNLINYIRGKDASDLSGSVNVRDRALNGHVWKLGDIVHSTPVSISSPPDNFGLIYSDESYQTYYSHFKNRETVVYVGANDGMLHAFTSWVYDPDTQQFNRPSGAPSSEHIGKELWAYIPQALLPHLKWLADPEYTHVYYVDLKPKVFDAKIFDDDVHYTDSDTDPNWGTVLVCGLGTGGAHIWSEDDFDYNISTPNETRNFYPSYAAIDITDPRDPHLLWERTYTGLGLTTNIPGVVKVQDKWYLIITSGPTDYAGTSSQKGHVFVVDLKTGDPVTTGTTDYLFETPEKNAFLTSPSSLDKNVNFSVDAIYFGESYLQGSSWRGKIYKIGVPTLDSDGNYDDSNSAYYTKNPIDASHPWEMNCLAELGAPFTAAPALSVDWFDNAWLYIGTGRYINESDKTTTDQQYIFGFKDPFYNRQQTSYYHNYSANLTLTPSDLFDADPYTVLNDGSVYDGSNYVSFLTVLNEAIRYDGWKKSLIDSGERIINKSTILGGIVLTPSFTPNSDVCGFGGTSKLYGLYYETGTAYKKPVFTPGTIEIDIGGERKQKVLDSLSLGDGLSASVGIHVGKEKGARGFIQQSTGNIIDINLNPVLNIKSGLTNWKEK